MNLSQQGGKLMDAQIIRLTLPEGNWKTAQADIVTAENVRDYNSFDEPFRICDRPFASGEALEFSVPRHSVVRLCLTRET